MTQLICQWVIAVLFAFGILSSVYFDFHGRKEAKPGGFVGFIIGLILFPIIFWIHVQAGTFSLIFRSSL
jgi:hypothetical protein